MAPEGISQGVGCLLWALSNKAENCYSRATSPGLHLCTCANTEHTRTRHCDGWWGHQDTNWKDSIQEVWKQGRTVKLGELWGSNQASVKDFLKGSRLLFHRGRIFALTARGLQELFLQSGSIPTYQHNHTVAKDLDWKIIPHWHYVVPFVCCREDTVSEKDHVGNGSDKNKQQ